MTVATEKPQHLVSLAEANRIRLARADLKGAIKNREVLIPEILEAEIPEWLDRMPVLLLLEAVKGLALKKASLMLQRAELGQQREVGWITARQRIVLSTEVLHWEAKRDENREKNARRRLAA